MHTTLNKIYTHRPCKRGWDTLLAHLGKTDADDEPLPLLTILESNGFDDALWALRAVDGHEQVIRAFSLWCVARVRHLIRSPALAEALATVEGLATDEERARAQRFALAIASQPDRFRMDSRIAAAVWCAAEGDAYGEAVGGAADAAALLLDYPAERAAQEAELRRILASSSAPTRGTTGA